MIRIAVLGEVGSRNLGDDLGFFLLRDELLQCFRELDVRVHIDYFTPARFSDLDHASHQVVVTGCGTLLDEGGGVYVRQLVRMRERGAFVSTLGTGLSDPLHMTPSQEGRIQLREVVSKFRHGWIRGQDGPDLMWLNGPIAGQARRDLVGVNMGFAAYTNVDINQIWGRLRSLIWELQSQQQNVVLVSCWLNDNVWFRRDFPNARVLQIGGSRTSLEQLSSLKTLISFRGHLGVLGCCAGVNVLPVLFSTKVEDMYGQTAIRTFPLSPLKDDWSDIVATALASGPVDNGHEVRILQERVKSRIRAFAEEVRRSYA